MLYHYTTLETFLRIIEGITDDGNEPYLHLRATRIDQVNDPTEMNTDISKLSSILQEYETQKDIENKCLSDKITKVNPNEVQNILKKEKEEHLPYITCLSTRKDYLPMWSLYGDKHHGVCLCFTEELLENVSINKNEDNIIRGEVAYKKHDKSIAIQDALDLCFETINKKGSNSDITDTIAELFLFISPYIKNINYAYEKEYRICLYNFQKKTDPKMGEITEYNKDGEYVMLDIPLYSLKYIILGAKTPKLLESILKDYFNKKNYKIKIERSKIPYK